MNKIKTTILILTFLFSLTLTFNNVKAEHNHQEEKEPFYLDLVPRNVPLFCGATGYVFQTAFELFGEQMMSGAKVRENAKPNGKVIGVLSFTYNENTNTGTFMMTIPETGETCILAYGVEWEFYKDILVEGNASKQ